MKTLIQLKYTKSIASLSIFLVLALLLSTDNLSVVVAALLVIISIGYIITHRNDINIDSTDKIVIICLGAYLLSNIPLAIVDIGNFRYFRGASRLVLCIPIYFFFKYYSPTSNFYYKPLILGVFFGSLGAFVIACYQFFIEDRPRVDGFLFSINFGYLACSLAVLSIALFVYKYQRWLLSAAFFMSISAMLMTLTRGAIFALPILLFLFIFINFKKIGAVRIVLIVSTFFSLAIGSYFFSDQIRSRVDFTIYEASNISNGHLEKAVSTGGRIMLWRASIEAFKESPVIGLTYSERERLNQDLGSQGLINSWAAGLKRGHAHSQYFEQLASGGLMGIIAIFLTFIVPLAYFFKRHKNSNAAYIGVFFIASFLIFCLTEVALQQNLISTFYGFMLALLFSATQLEIRNNTNDE